MSANSTRMVIATGKETLERLVTTQVANIFLLDSPGEQQSLLTALSAALLDVERCFVHVDSRYYRNAEGQVLFDPYQTSQYACFLYFMSRRLWTHGAGPRLAAKVYALNKMLHGCDLFYEVELPEIFTFDHPVGTVLGRAKYGNFFRFSQNCTVGHNHGVYPAFGECVSLFPFARVVGSCRIGNHVIISHGAYVKNTDIPDNSLVFGRSPNLLIKSRPTTYFQEQCGFFSDRSQA